MIQSYNGDDDRYWSPYDCLIGATLTDSGLLQRSAATEVELYTTIVPTSQPPCIELRAAPESTDMMVPMTLSGEVDRNKKASQFRDRTSFPFQIIVTTHRLVFVRDACRGREARYLHLSNVFTIGTESNYFKSAKIILSTAIGELLIAFKKHPDVNPTKLRDECHSHLMNSFEKKQWDIDDQQQTQKDLQRKMITNRKVGVDAILSASQQRHAHAAQITNRAFESTSSTGKGNPSTGASKNQKKKDDLDTFLQEATELVQIIHKYVATLDRSLASSNASSDTDQLVNMLQDMGMTSILNKADFKKRRTKNSGGNSSLDVYYDTMARQIVDLIRPKLQQQKVPIMTLTDVYCLYNRSRGTHLISPDDLVAAVERLADLPHLGLVYVTFPNSGLKVLQDSSRTDPTTLTNTFLSLCERHGGYITALTVSQCCNISSVLAMEQLQMIEQRQVLVRDETLEAIRFYPNLFFQ